MKFKIFFQVTVKFKSSFFFLPVLSFIIINHNNQFTTFLPHFSPIQNIYSQLLTWKLAGWNLLRHKNGVNCLPPPSRLLFVLSLQRKFLNLRFGPRLKQSVPLPSHVSISCFWESVEKFYCSHEEIEITGQVQLDDHPSDTWPISLLAGTTTVFLTGQFTSRSCD